MGLVLEDCCLRTLTESVDVVFDFKSSISGLVVFHCALLKQPKAARNSLSSTCPLPFVSIRFTMLFHSERSKLKPCFSKAILSSSVETTPHIRVRVRIRIRVAPWGLNVGEGGCRQRSLCPYPGRRSRQRTGISSNMQRVLRLSFGFRVSGFWVFGFSVSMRCVNLQYSWTLARTRSVAFL